ncbi:hypothetical protein PY365_04670 [Roseiarcaceae bacterium H3SJ34-1]|uniref:recombinase-like helix-turn-helix domain-containing protein n=1 Tax=Terripilifer ovatus TaxID=3032367 RepID=UPI003AB97FFF|nr:hypothetical protein [Roseiarcaceae bacterium H3SJ34-1]
MPHYNPHLKAATPDAGASPRRNGTYERYDMIDNIFIQTRSAPPAPWENALANAMENAFLAGVSTLPELVIHLTGAGLAHPSGAAWTEANLLGCLEVQGEIA